MGPGEAERIVAPTLVPRGDRDRVVPERMALEIVEDLDRAPCRWVWSTAAILRWWIDPEQLFWAG